MRLLSSFWVQKKIFVTNPFFYTSSWFLKGNLYTVIVGKISPTELPLSSAYAPFTYPLPISYPRHPLHFLYFLTLELPFVDSATHLCFAYLTYDFITHHLHKFDCKFPQKFCQEILRRSVILYFVSNIGTNYHFPQTPTVNFLSSHILLNHSPTDSTVYFNQYSYEITVWRNIYNHPFHIQSNSLMYIMIHMYLEQFFFNLRFYMYHNIY